MTKERIRILAECAILVALSFVLSLIKVWQMPLGGSVTLLSMLPVCLIGIRHGTKWGLGAAFVYSITQALVSGAAGWGLTPAVLIICFLLDYILPFTLLGLSGVFKSRGTPGIISGIAMVCVIRFLCHFASGVTIWRAGAFEEGYASAELYSLLYNGFYMLPELILTVIGAFFVIKALKKKVML